MASHTIFVRDVKYESRPGRAAVSRKALISHGIGSCQKMKVLITGGAGFIGSAVIRHIIRNTDSAVVNLDKLTYAGNLESLDAVSSDPRYRFEQVDICDRAELDRVFRTHQPDAVMHLAAESHVDRSIDGPATFIKTNIVGTYNMLEAAQEAIGLD